MKNKRLLGFLTSLLLFSGCASAELELTVDIYNKDIVSENHWTKKHIKHLELSKFAADKIASQRIEQAETFVELYKDYEDYYNLIENKKTTSESSTLENLRAQLSIYKNTLEQKRQTIHNLANQSAKNLKKIISPSHPPDVLSQLRNGLPSVNVFLLAEEINKSLKELGTKNFETNFEKNSEIIFNELAPYFSSKEFGKKFQDSEAPDKYKKASALIKRNQNLLSQQQNLSENFEKQLKELDSVNPLKEPGTAIARASGIAVQTWAEISKNRGLNSQAKLAISGLAQGIDFKNSQIDRIQDSADPAWREIISKPGTNDDKHWSPLFARTYFRAEGNNSVVIARERPGHYRMKRGSNDPAALIKGQLRINRAIASGLIDVVGAYAGITGASDILPEAPKNSKAPSGEEVTISKKEAQLNAKAKFRKSARKALKKRIIQMRDSVKKEAETDNGSLKPLIKPINPGTYHNIHSMIDGFQVTFDRISED